MPEQLDRPIAAELSKGERDLDKLFDEKDLACFLEHERRSAETYVDSIPEEQFLRAPDNTLLEGVLSGFETSPIVLNEDTIEQVSKETALVGAAFGKQVTIPGLEITITIAFTGLAYLWKLRPNPSLMRLPRGSIQASGEETGYLNISFKLPSNAGAERFKKAISDVLENIRTLLEYQRKEISQSNEALKIRVNRALQNRRERLKTHAKIVKPLSTQAAFHFD